MVMNDGGSATYRAPSSSEMLRKMPKYTQEPVAIIGMGCRLPGHSTSPHKLWQFLEKGGIANNAAPESRFRLNTHHDGSKKPKTMRSPGGMFIEDVDPKRFDAAFFGTSRADAVAMDPQQRQLLEVVYECLENAGYTLDQLDGADVGCFVGSYAVDYADMQARDPEDRVPSVTIGVGRAILSNRISHFLNIQGPSMTIDTACSGSLVGVDVACRYLSSGEIDGAIVAGANLYLSPEHNMDVGPMKGASSLTGKCHTFDVKADGYIKGEAINCVMLKRLSDAQRDRDPIRGIIRGTATNSDGKTPGIASPSSEAQTKAILSAYANAGISDFNATGYIEMHGTGTQAGDPQEVKGVAAVFAPSRPADKPLVIGSIKSNIGHSEPAAGVSGLIKATLAVESGLIPGNPTFVDPNPKIDFEGSKVRATRISIPWPHSGLRRASVNSFGYGGSNAHAIIEQVPEADSNFVSSYSTNVDNFLDDGPTITRPHVILLSANNDTSIKAYTASLRTHLLNPQVKVDVEDLAYTLSERRTHHFHRGFIVAKDLSLDPNEFILGKKSTESPRIGFIFTGQGAQWSQMGKSLVDNFPEAKQTLIKLDEALQALPHPPSWSLLKELTEVRSPELLRRPEFSQPLVTALQLAIVAVFQSWGISGQSVIGHSSGEIAAAYAAGHLSEKDAIIAAYYRGYAAKTTFDAEAPSVGMMAVGLGAEAVADFLQGQETVSIACYNSPNSVTLSGPSVDLDEVRSRLVAENHFARMLQVNMAYHSPYMKDAGDEYTKCLDESKFQANPRKEGLVPMYSSVSGRQLDDVVDAAYWKANMISPVRFNEALHEMLSAQDAPNFLIEIGPSGALAGPVSQVKKSVAGGGVNTQYYPALMRGREAEKAIFSVAGRIFVAGGKVDFRAVNRIRPSAKTIVDLPNYEWNHSSEYWYENEASEDWRNRKFSSHDLLGSKVLGVPWSSPTFKKTLRVEDLPWLRDHRLGPEIVFPGAGYMAMATEAMRQCSIVVAEENNKEPLEAPTFRLRNVTFDRALVLEEDKNHRIMLTLSPLTGPKDSWYQWKVLSLNDGTWIDHCQGLVRVESPVHVQASSEELAALKYPTTGSAWYKSMLDVGYGFGKAFQKLQLVETQSGERKSRALVSLSNPDSSHNQSYYPMHPACIDGCMQTSAPSLWNGIKSSVNAVLVPAVIDDLLIKSVTSFPDLGMAISTSKFAGPGRRDLTKNYVSDAQIYDPNTGELIWKLSGLRYHMLDFQDSPYAAHKYSRLLWKQDVSLSPWASSLASSSSDWAQVHEVCDLVAHKIPNAKIMEINVVLGDSTSVWLTPSTYPRAAYTNFKYVTDDASVLVLAQDKYNNIPRAEFQMLNFFDPVSISDEDKSSYDLVIVRIPTRSADNLEALINNVKELLVKDGKFLLLEQRAPYIPEQANEKVPVIEANGFMHSDQAIQSSQYFTLARELSCEGSSSLTHAYLSVPRTQTAELGSVDIVHLADPGKVSQALTKALHEIGWNVNEVTAINVAKDVRENSIVLVLSELDKPLLPTLTSDQWSSMQVLLSVRNRILWVSQGSQWQVDNPDGAMIHGLCRTVRAENPAVSVTTIDVEQPTSKPSIQAINTVLSTLQGIAPLKQIENEYVERNGIIHVSRVLSDEPINSLESAIVSGADIVNRKLHKCATQIRLQAERVGTIDSLQYAEVSSEESPVPDNNIECELFASALNFKDVAVTMGIVPENPYLLGLEGAGTIRRVGKNLRTPFHIGQRVLVFEKGTFGNRIQATTERTIAIPDSMSYEEAATLPSVYLTAQYSLFNLAQTKRGDKVLIHSASGGLGIACIWLCKYIGAEIFATVGSDEKRRFLVEEHGISQDHIFNSRSTAFERELMLATNCYGVDVIINSLTGDLLDASWRCIAESGTMVELGKRDMLDRNMLAMEPFGRNASYRCFDMSHKCVTDEVIAVLMKQMMALIVAGHTKPIVPMKLFPYDDIPSAFRFMRGANHIGKLIISNKAGETDDPTVNVRPALGSFKLRGDISYLIIGGLKGLCGSLAIDMARHGAKRVVILGRSGYDDDRSQSCLADLRKEGCEADLVRGDVSKIEDVRRAFKEATLPVGGIIQGAMVLRDKPFETMTHADYHTTIESKVQGTWNLHNVSQECGLELDFFTMLSSISGLVGQPGQANYAAANVFLDNFAAYRRGLGLKATSVDLGAIEDVGYMSVHSDLIAALDTSAWTPINEPLFHKIVRYSILQQRDEPVNISSNSQLITSIAVPQKAESKLQVDARFGGLFFGSDGSGAGSDSSSANKEIQTLLLMIKSGSEAATVQTAAVEVVGKQFQITLRLEEPMEPGKPLSAYGLDSLAAVEFRNWARMHLGAELTTLEITGAGSLMALSDKIVAKMRPAHPAEDKKA